MPDSGVWHGDPALLAPDREWVLKILRYRPGQTQGAEKALAEVEAARAAIIAAAQPRVAWRDLSLTHDGPTLTFGKVSVTNGKLAQHLDGCGAVIVIAATVGEEVDAANAAMMQAGQYARAVAGDAWGSACVESAADQFTATLPWPATSLRERFSSGYSGWSQTDNAALLALLPPCDITANLAGMLTPQKSITALIGRCDSAR